MKKADANARPYKKGSKLIKYQEGEENLQGGEFMYDNVTEKNKAIDDAIKAGVPSTIQKYISFGYNPDKNKEPEYPVSTEANPILYKEPKIKMAGNVLFKEMTSAQQKQYRAGIASGREFNVEGIGGKYGATNKLQQTQPTKTTKTIVKTTTPASNTGSNKNTAKPVQKNTQTPAQTPAQNTKQTNTQNTSKNTAQKNTNTKAATNTGKGTIPVPPQQKNVVSKKTARHTTDDPGKKMVNRKEIPSEKKQTTPKRERRVYPGESPLVKYKDRSIYNKPVSNATTTPSKIMDYRAQQNLMSKRDELAKNMKAYGMTSPYNEGGGDNMTTRLFEIFHNTRFGKKK